MQEQGDRIRLIHFHQFSMQKKESLFYSHKMQKKEVEERDKPRFVT